MDGGSLRSVGRTPRLILPEHNPTEPRSTTAGLRLTARAKERTMQEARSSAPFDTRTIGCHRCDAQASIRKGKVFLCPPCAAADTGTPSESPLIVCDLCDGESLVRVGELFLCARCALAALFVTANDVQATGGLAPAGAMRLVDIAAAHHQALTRSMKRARDPLECVERVDAGAVLFDVWAASFDARQEELERKNEVLARMSEELDRQVEELCRERDEMRGTLSRAAADRSWEGGA